jgi:NAD(P)H-dependent FMN reductase
MEILALCGSIRSDSSNQAIISAIHRNLPQLTKFTQFEIKELPFFDPELQFSENLPPIVKSLRNLASKSDYILISSPEYIHSIPGALKNCLEWLLCEETMKKKAVVVIGSPSGGSYLKDQLLDTLSTMDFVISSDSILVIQSARSGLSQDGNFVNEELKVKLLDFIKKNFKS